MERRRLFTTDQFVADGGTPDELRWAVRAGTHVRVERGVYAEGSDPPTDLDCALARLLASNTPAWGVIAGTLYGLDAMPNSFELPGRWQTSEIVGPRTVIGGFQCTSALQTIVDLAEFLKDDEWEQALESALHKRLIDLDELIALVPLLAKTRRHGSTRIRRVLALRPIGAPPTESLLETLMVQLIRKVPGLPPPVRQYEVRNAHGTLVARVDLCWPEFGLFIELDGMHHAGQPVYDASRETAVVAATGWLPGRFTWRQVRFNPRATVRQLADLVAQARSRPLVASV